MVDQILVQPITAEQLHALEAEGRHYEIYQGQLREKPVASKGHGRVETNLLLIIGAYVKQHQLGRTYPGDTTYVVEGTKQRLLKALMPDVSFIAAGRETDTDLEDYLYLAPDLAIEVISSSESASDIAAKIKVYLEFGAQQVWTVYPNSELRQVVVHTPDGTSQTYNSGDTITLDPLIPGLVIPVTSIFE